MLPHCSRWAAELWVADLWPDLRVYLWLGAGVCYTFTELKMSYFTHFYERSRKFMRKIINNPGVSCLPGSSSPRQTNFYLLEGRSLRFLAVFLFFLASGRCIFLLINAFCALCNYEISFGSRFCDPNSTRNNNAAIEELIACLCKFLDSSSQNHRNGAKARSIPMPPPFPPSFIKPPHPSNYNKKFNALELKLTLSSWLFYTLAKWRYANFIGMFICENQIGKKNISSLNFIHVLKIYIF